MKRTQALIYGKSWLEDEYLDATDKEFIEAALQALEQEPKWIPVSERLPNNDEDVFVYSCRHGIDIQYYDDTGWHDIHNDALCSETIAWMPLPEPYRAEQEPTDWRGKYSDDEQAYKAFAKEYINRSQAESEE